MNIENKTKHTIELDRAFQKIHYRLSLFPFQIGFFITLVVIAVLGFIDNNIDFGIFILAIAIISNLLIIWIYKLSIKKANSSYKIMQERPLNHYVFGEEEVKIESTATSASSSTVLAYSTIHLVVVTDKLIVLYLNKVLAYLVDNNGYFSGSRDELVELLKRKVTKLKVLGNLTITKTD